MKIRSCIGLLFLLAATSCSRVSQSEARRLVEHYNKVVAEAYRRGDVELIDPVVGPNEGKKITGLIGVRTDGGMTLDSELLSLEIRGVEMDGTNLLVHTSERWHYRDLQIGSGRQVGETSLDSYEMLYRFIKMNGKWMVDEIRFEAPPQVGRKNGPWKDPQPVSHGGVPQQ